MFCSQCGTQVLEEANFCPKCGNSFVKESQEQKFKLTIYRVKQWYLIKPRVRVVIDRIASYELENGGSIVIPVKAGVHNVAFSHSILDKIIEVNITRDLVLNMGFNKTTGMIEIF